MPQYDWNWDPNDVTITDANFKQMQKKLSDGTKECRRTWKKKSIGREVDKLEKLADKIDAYKLAIVRRLAHNIDDVSVTDGNLKLMESMVEEGKKAYNDIVAPADNLHGLHLAVKIDMLVDKINAFKRENGITELTSSLEVGA